MQLSGGGESVLLEPLTLTITFDGGTAPLKSFKDAAWTLNGTLTLLEGGETVELSDPAAFGEGVPQPAQDTEGKWLLQLEPASPGVLSLTLALTGPKNLSLEAAVQHTILPLLTPQELLEAAVAAGDEEALGRLFDENTEVEWSWDHSVTCMPLLALLGPRTWSSDVLAAAEPTTWRLKAPLSLAHGNPLVSRAKP